MTNRFADRFATELLSWLPDDVEVSADRVMVVITRGTASVPMFTPRGDQRRRVDTEEARAFLADAAHKLRGEIPKYCEEFKAPARELADILYRAAGGETTPDGADDGTTADALAPVEKSRKPRRPLRDVTHADAEREGWTPRSRHALPGVYKRGDA